ncbi:hypothetical protein BT93_C2449 [Corymbia citriodora subsp. variegata]|nr:hypothetical protein BT93_C2449 [Corymbia citriodora subsp. variegata]
MTRIEFSANPTHLLKHPHPRPPPPSDQDETRNSSVDYISELPVAIILHIFSFLTTKDAIKTSVLSKRWRSIWTANPHISFSMPSCCGTSRSKFRSFMSFMNAVLLRCTALACNDRWLRSAIGPTIDRWLQFTVEHDLEEVSITLHNDVYTLPQFFFRCTTLVSFHVYGCSFSTVGAVNWTSLKRLRFDHAKLKDNAIMRILNGCPILEFVELKDCWGFKHIKIKSRGMREMVIHSHTFSGEVLKISAPHLLKLRILGNSNPGEFKVDKVSSLVEVELNFKISAHSPGHGKAQGDLVKTLLQSLHHVTKLVIGSLYLQVLSLTEPREVFLPSLECRHLMFRVAEDHVGEAGIAKILESSPYLEKLILQMTCTPTSRVNNC